MSVDPDLHPRHPLNMLWSFIRVWLGLLIFSMICSAATSRAIFLEDPVRPIPYVIVALVALVWYLNPRSLIVTRWATAVCAGLLGLRAVEILLLSDGEFRARVTPTLLWMLAAVATYGAGLVAAYVISRRLAEIEVWGDET